MCIRDRYDTWEWNYGNSPAYAIVKERRFDGCGKLEVHMNVEKGMKMCIRDRLKSAIRDDDPVICMEHKLLYAKKEQIPEEEYTIPLGVADVKREGSDITIITWSREVYFALEAAEKLAAEGIQAEVLDLRTLVPLDWDAIVASVSKTHNVIVVSEEVKRGSYAAEISAQIAEELFDELDAPVELSLIHI